MPPTSPDGSSTNAKPAAKRSAHAAALAAASAFQNHSSLSLDRPAPAGPADQEHRRRLPGSYLIRREMIVPDPDQPRREFSRQEMEELAASIRARGVKQPLTVRWDVERSKYVVIDGGRRFLAASRLQLEELPCWIRHGEKKDVLIDQIVHNWQRASLRPYETADALARLRDEFGLSQRELAEVTGKPKGEISKLLALRDKVVPTVQELARSEAGEAVLTKRHLYNISRLKPDKQQVVAERVRQESLTAIDTERLVAEHTGSEARPKRRQGGMAARRRRFRTSRADVLMTFHKANVTEEDVLAVLDELRRTIAG